MQCLESKSNHRKDNSRFRKRIADVCSMILIVVVALPLLLLLKLISLFVPQKKWEEFWDLFLFDCDREN